MGDHLPLPPGSTSDKGVFCKAAFMVSSGGRNCCSCGMNFCAYWDLLFLGERGGGEALAELPPPPPTPSPGSTTDNGVLLAQGKKRE